VNNNRLIDRVKGFTSQSTHDSQSPG